MISTPEAAVVGIAAGFGIAIPLGPIGILLVRLGLTRGFRAAASASLGVAVVDLVYCVLAITAGTQIAPVIGRWGAWPLCVSGAVLIGIALRQLATLRRDLPPSPTVRSRSLFLRFFGLTALNPMTVLYFAALATALATQAADTAARVVFVFGVGVASAMWQLLLAAVGSLLHRSASPCAMRVLGIVGSTIVLILGMAAVARGFGWV